MANVQTENGYTRIAHELLEEVAKRKFNGTQFRILMVVWRYTYGFQRKDHEISLTFLSKATGVSKNQCKRELDFLIDSNVILVSIPDPDNCYTNSRRLGFNKNYKKWKLVDCTEKSTQYPNKSTVPKKDNGTVPELEYGTVPELEYQDKYIKDKYKDKIPFKEIIDYLNEKTNSKYKSTAAGNKKKISARWNEGYRVDDFFKVIDFCVEKWSGQTFGNGQRGDDYLRPSTLFNEKFDERLNKAESELEETEPTVKVTEEQRIRYRMNELSNDITLGERYFEDKGMVEQYHAAVKEYDELEQQLQSYQN